MLRYGKVHDCGTPDCGVEAGAASRPKTGHTTEMIASSWTLNTYCLLKLCKGFSKYHCRFQVGPVHARIV
jgi:hypothetical protein